MAHITVQLGPCCTVPFRDGAPVPCRWPLADRCGPTKPDFDREPGLPCSVSNARPSDLGRPAARALRIASSLQPHSGDAPVTDRRLLLSAVAAAISTGRLHSDAACRDGRRDEQACRTPEVALRDSMSLVDAEMTKLGTLSPAAAPRVAETDRARANCGRRSPSLFPASSTTVCASWPRRLATPSRSRPLRPRGPARRPRRRSRSVSAPGMSPLSAPSTPTATQPAARPRPR